MDKVKKFLEAYCQWVAIGLGVAFLGWTVYSYVVVPPVTATVGTEAGVTPPEINNRVWDTVGRNLDDQLKSTQTPQNITPTVDYPKLIVDKFSEFPSSVATNLKSPYTPLWTPMDDSLDAVGPGVILTKVELPTVPVLIDLMWSKGHSNVQPPQAPGGQQQNVALAALDKQWITVGANVPVGTLAKNFTDAKVPAVFSIATIYRVTAVRQEMDAAGNWGNDTTLEPLEINPMIPLPAKDCNFQARQDYKTWAETQQNVVTICEPAFYTVLQGDIWYEPGFPNPNDKSSGAVVNPFDPKNPLAFTGDPNSLLPDEKAIWDKAKADKARADARSGRNGSTGQPTVPSNVVPPSPGSSGRSGRSGRNAAPIPEPRNPGDMLLPPPRSGTPGGYQSPPPGYPGPGGSPAGNTPAMPASSVASLPNPGSFSPADRVAAATAAGGTGNIKVWVHDTNVQAGKTYRYKLKYTISNPVAGTTNLCKNPADAQIAWLESDWSAWGEPITVESDSNFYAVDAKHGIRFDIFKWKNGVWQKQSVYANNGDRIGNMDTASKTDFDTGWTLVDIREDPAGNTENKILVLVSDNGTVKEKEISTDRQNSTYRKLLGEVTAAADKTASR